MRDRDFRISSAAPLAILESFSRARVLSYFEIKYDILKIYYK